MRKYTATLRRIAGELKELRKEIDRAKLRLPAIVSTWMDELTSMRDKAMILSDEMEEEGAK